MPGEHENELYQPCHTEPSVFCGSRSGIPIEWGSWKEHIHEVGRGRVMKYRLRRCGESTHQFGNALKARIRAELTLFRNVELPEQPPSLYATGTNFISLMWVLDTARRERMSPEEAYVVGQALRKMAEDEIYG